MPGRVCEKHERYVHEGEECPHCEPEPAATPWPLLVWGRPPPGHQLGSLYRQGNGPAVITCACGEKFGEDAAFKAHREAQF